MDVSIDIETLSSRPNALVTQIGACAFDRFSNVILKDTFLANCSYSDVWPYPCPYDIDYKTALWWMDQTDEARHSLLLPPPKPISDALAELNTWIFATAKLEWRMHEIEHYVWANSPSFDLVILRHAMAVEGLSPVWHFKQEHDMRTIVTMAKECGRIVKVSEEGLIHHRADHDAIRQAKIIQLATRCIKNEQ